MNSIGIYKRTNKLEVYNRKVGSRRLNKKHTPWLKNRARTLWNPQVKSCFTYCTSSDPEWLIWLDRHLIFTLADSIQVQVAQQPQRGPGDGQSALLNQQQFQVIKRIPDSWKVILKITYRDLWHSQDGYHDDQQVWVVHDDPLGPVCLRIQVEMEWCVQESWVLYLTYHEKEETFISLLPDS